MVTIKEEKTSKSVWLNVYLVGGYGTHHMLPGLLAVVMVMMAVIIVRRLSVVGRKESCKEGQTSESLHQVMTILLQVPG